jgi:hypothetical protein
MYRHCEERSDEAIQNQDDFWIASLPFGRLAMTIGSLFPAFGRRSASSIWRPIGGTFDAFLAFECTVIARSEATKQSKSRRGLLDCFVALRAPRNDDRIALPGFWPPERVVDLAVNRRNVRRFSSIQTYRHCEERSDEAIHESPRVAGLLRCPSGASQ